MLWYQKFRSRYQHIHSVGAPLSANHNFPPSLLDDTFAMWARLGIKTIKDMYVDDIFASFQQLADKFSLPKGQFFRYPQARNWACTTFPEFPALPNPSNFEVCLNPLVSLRGAISKIYADIYNLCLGPSATLKKVWETDLDMTISDEEWVEIQRRVHKSSICARHSFIRCWILHRAHYTKARLAKMFNTVSSLCDRCKQYTASYIHIFWSCPSFNGFWSEIFMTLSKVIGKDIVPNALIALFGTWPSPFALSPIKKDLKL